MRATELGWLATATGICPIHGETETWGVKAPTAALALEGLEGFKTDLTAGEHELDVWAPTAGKIFPLPSGGEMTVSIEELDPVEKAARAVWAELEHLSRSDRLTVLRQAISAEDWPRSTARKDQHAGREREPYPRGSLAARRAVAEEEADPDVGVADPDLSELPIPPCDGGQIP